MSALLSHWRQKQMDIGQRFKQKIGRHKQHNKAWIDHEYLVLDMETTGLDATKDRVISLGWVLIKNGAIKLSSARHILLDNGPVDEKTVAIHMITDQDISELGRNPSVAMRYLRQLLLDKVLVVHHAPIEQAFLEKLWQAHKLNPLTQVMLDTLAMERDTQMRKQYMLTSDAFRLGECRKRYGLPDYQGHDALGDAQATAELLLAQLNHAGLDTNLKDLIRKGGKLLRFKA